MREAARKVTRPFSSGEKEGGVVDLFFKWLPAIIALFNVGVLWIGWSMKRIADQAIATVRDDIGDHEERLIRLEETVKALPSSRDVTRLREEIGKLAGDVKALSRDVQGVSDAGKTVQKGLDFLNQYLMEHGPK